MTNFVGITRIEFLSKFKWIYRFTNIERFAEQLSTRKFSFINPSKWADPFEKFFLEREYLIEHKKVTLPIKDSIFCVCLSGTKSSEAYWKVYAPKENGIRLTFDAEKLVSALDDISDCDVFIGRVDYEVTAEFYKISFDKEKLINEIEDCRIGDQQIKLLLKKRKAFLYEDEVRILVAPRGKLKELTVHRADIDIIPFTTEYLLDPRIEKYQVKLLKDFYFEKHNIKLVHSKLYADIPKDKIILR